VTTDSDWRARASEVWTVPNLISLSRLPLLVGIVLLVDSLWRYPLFALVVVSDGLDGWVARRLDQTTQLGALLDPALDKLTALVLVVALFPRLGLDPAYLALFFARDGFVLSLGVLVPLYGFETGKIKARLAGKVVTNLQFLAMIAMLVPHTDATVALMWALGVAAAVAIADYTVFVARELSDRPWVHTRAAAIGASVAVTGAFVAVVWVFLRVQFVAFVTGLV